MRNVPSDKYNVAWFKLAECVSRGEKEKALGVYRLLSHSLHDPAFARQLQGDILFAFNDITAAVQHYDEAARMYLESARMLEAAAIYEHCMALLDDKQLYLQKLIQIYSSLTISKKVIAHGAVLFSLFLAKKDFNEMLLLLTLLENHAQKDELLSLKQQLVIAMLQENSINPELYIPYVEQIITNFIQHDDSQQLHRFLATLQALNADCAQKAQEYMHAFYK